MPAQVKAEAMDEEEELLVKEEMLDEEVLEEVELEGEEAEEAAADALAKTEDDDEAGAEGDAQLVSVKDEVADDEDDEMEEDPTKKEEEDDQGLEGDHQEPELPPVLVPKLELVEEEEPPTETAEVEEEEAEEPESHTLLDALRESLDGAAQVDSARRSAIDSFRSFCMNFQVDVPPAVASKPVEEEVNMDIQSAPLEPTDMSPEANSPEAGPLSAAGSESVTPPETTDATAAEASLPAPAASTDKADAGPAAVPSPRTPPMEPPTVPANPAAAGSSDRASVAVAGGQAGAAQPRGRAPALRSRAVLNHKTLLQEQREQEQRELEAYRRKQLLLSRPRPGINAPMEYLVDNSQLNAPTKGLRCRVAMDLEQRHPDEALSWGSIIRGEDMGNGWFRLPSGLFAPIWVNNVQVIVPNTREEVKRPRKLAPWEVQAQGSLLPFSLLDTLVGVGPSSQPPPAGNRLGNPASQPPDPPPEPGRQREPAMPVTPQRPPALVEPNLWV